MSGHVVEASIPRPAFLMRHLKSRFPRSFAAASGSWAQFLNGNKESSGFQEAQRELVGEVKKDIEPAVRKKLLDEYAEELEKELERKASRDTNLKNAVEQARKVHGGRPFEIDFAVGNTSKIDTTGLAADIADDYMPGVMMAAGWRASKGVYRFDPALFDELWISAGGTQALQVPDYERLPESCPYVWLPEPVRFDIGTPHRAILHGFFLTLMRLPVHDGGKPVRQLVIALDLVREGESIPSVYPAVVLSETCSTLEEALQLYASHVPGDGQYATYLKGYAEYIAKILSVAGYLCAPEPEDIVDVSGRASAPPTPVIKHKRGGCG